MCSDKIVKVNIGSGPHGKSDWINLDWGILAILSKMPYIRRLLVSLYLLPKNYERAWPGNLRLWNCQRRLRFSDFSVNYIYTSHFIEHLPRYKTIELLTECKRVLCPSGILRISIPDLKMLAERYVQSDSDFFSSLDDSDAGNLLKNLGDQFAQHLYGYDCWSAPTFIQRLQRKFIRGHLWMYDYDSLSDILHNAGFSNVERCEAGEGKVPDIEYLDIHRIGSLFVEASCGQKKMWGRPTE